MNRRLRKMFPELIFLLFFVPSNLCRSLPLTLPHPTRTDAQGAESSEPLLENENFWVHIAKNVLNISNFCVRTGMQANSVLSSCLIGVCTPPGVLQNHTIFKKANNEPLYSYMYSWGLNTRNKDKDMYSIQLSQVTNASVCVNFTHCPNRCLDLGKNNHLQCEVTSQEPSAYFHTKLPSGWFLICGFKAFSYIPANTTGGPCSIGRLTVNLPQKQYFEENHRTKRKLVMDENCYDDSHLFSQAEYVSLSVFLSPGSTVAAHVQTNKLACATAKALNVTSQALAAISEELGQVREAVLENRATIDYLLLLHNHGCEEFKGMCCFNVTDNSEIIESKRSKIKEQLNKFRQRAGFFGLDFSWLTSWLPNLSWLRHTFTAVLLVLLLGLFICCCIHCGPCCCSCCSYSTKKLSKMRLKKQKRYFSKRTVERY